MYSVQKALRRAVEEYPGASREMGPARARRAIQLLGGDAKAEASALAQVAEYGWRTAVQRVASKFGLPGTKTRWLRPERFNPKRPTAAQVRFNGWFKATRAGTEVWTNGALMHLDACEPRVKLNPKTDIDPVRMMVEADHVRASAGAVVLELVAIREVENGDGTRRACVYATGYATSYDREYIVIDEAFIRYWPAGATFKGRYDGGTPIEVWSGDALIGYVMPLRDKLTALPNLEP